MNNVPKCPCGNDCHMNKADKRKGYTKYCSDVCSRKYRNETKSYNTIASDYDWMYEQRITLQKSKEDIAELLGCSTSIVNKWIKIHKIPKVCFNESNAISKVYLEDRDFLYNLHVNERKTCEEIAEQIGSSKATISIWLNKHNITTNNTNTYPRKHIRVSKPCSDIVDFIKSIYSGEVIVNDRNFLGDGRELDIIVPEKKLAIEFNGIYSHIYRPEEITFSRRKDIQYHISKTEIVEEKGYQLLHIFSTSWDQKSEIWKSIIALKLGIIEERIYARNCVIRDVSVHDKRIFLDTNHLQGKDKSKYKLGLFYKEELVALITFARSRYNKSYEWELVRFAVKKNTVVIGGFTKLLSHFRKNFNGSIISYADRTYSKGDVYRNNGFTLLNINKPGYRYVDLNKNIMIHRQVCTKKELLKKCNKPNLTERQLSKELGLEIIFDCGTLAFVIQ